MGLAAGQARLLTITARKSDCEYESMRLSHQKIALSRELSDLSNEYQNSLNQTKLIYDYYGTGDTSTPLSYGLLMSPSTLNDYLPITITDSLGRVTLNSKYAAAARVLAHYHQKQCVMHLYKDFIQVEYLLKILQKQFWAYLITNKQDLVEVLQLL